MNRGQNRSNHFYHEMFYHFSFLLPQQEMDGEEEEEDDAEDGPENLCIKNTINNNNSESLSNNNSSANNAAKNISANSSGGGGGVNGNGSTGNGSTSSSNRIGLSLKDIRHLNRPPSHCRQNPFPSAAAHIDYAVAAAAAAEVSFPVKMLSHFEHIFQQTFSRRINSINIAQRRMHNICNIRRTI